jgi:tetratricopeptide (TPR) repeat protein
MLLAGIANSTITAFLLVELFRMAVRWTDGWSNRRHLVAVVSVSIAVCTWQITGAIVVSRPKIYYERGWARAEKGDYEGAIADLTKAIELNPKQARAYAERGWARRQRGDYDGAIADYNRAIELAPRVSSAYYDNRGLARLEKGDCGGAIADFTKVIELDPKHARAYVGRGTSRFYMGDNRGAIEDWQKAIALKPDLERQLDSWLKDARGRLRPANRSKK